MLHMLGVLSALLALPRISSPDMSTEAQKYLDSALDIIQDKSIKRNVDWMEMRRLAYVKAGNAKKPADTYDAIRTAVRFLNDHHSGFFTPEEVRQGDKGFRKGFGFLPAHGYVALVTPRGPAEKAGLRPGMKIVSIDGKGFKDDSEFFRLLGQSKTRAAIRCRLPNGFQKTITIKRELFDGFNPPLAKAIMGSYGYIRVPGFGGLGKVMNGFATQIQDGIRELDKRPLRGWIVDLRLNTGGNMFPMIAGLGPLLGNGDLGEFITSTERQTWFYRDGKTGIDTETILSIKPYKVKNRNLPMVVLIDDFTASSGEATAISFVGLPNVVLMGGPSAGLTTGNEFEFLSDGAAVNLCEAVEADRTGKVYGGKMIPDAPVRTNWADLAGPRDGAIVAAMKSIDARRGSHSRAGKTGA